MKKLTQEQVIERGNIIHNYMYDYSLSNYINSRTKIEIICKEHGIFKQTASSHIYGGKGCPKCVGRNRTHNEFIELSNKIHSNKYKYPDKYINSTKKINILCNEEGHGIFKQSPHLHLLGSGCPKCVGKNKTHNDFVKESNKIHGEYIYNEKYINSHTTIKILCPIHGEFKQKPYSHLQGSGCPKCIGKNKTHNDFVELSNKIHNNKYEYPDEYIDSKSKIKILCPVHGEFKQTPNSHLSGDGCPKCGGTCKLTPIEFIEKSNKIHGKYIYIDDYVNYKTKIKILCPIHGEFKQRPNDHLCGHGCPKCNSSKGEIIIQKYLNSLNIIYVNQKKFNGCKYKKSLIFDFYLSELNICIEFDGKQHFELIEVFGGEYEFNLTKIRDKIKDEYCKNNNIHLIRIPYTEIHNIENILKKELKIK